MSDAGTAGQRVYAWHGHPIRSCLDLDWPLATATTPLAPLRVAVDASLGEPPGDPLRQSPWTGFRLHADGEGCWLARADLRVRIQPAQITLSARPDAAGLEYLKTRVLALWLHLIDAPPIHASAVARDGSALAFLGASGAGKSTLCAAMHALGWQPVADDLLPIAADADGVRVYPGHGHVHLWPDSARHLLGDIERLARVPGQGDKRRLPAASAAPARLHAILLLQRDGDLRTPTCTRLRGPPALLALLKHGQMAGCAELLGLGGRRLVRFGAALAHVGVHEFAYPDALDALPAACALAGSLLAAGRPAPDRS